MSSDLMDDQAIAAVIPVYNGERFVRGAIDSVRRQSRPPSTILIVDDCSTDGTPELVRTLATADPRVQLLAMPSNGGPARARNAALRHLGEPIVAFLDADDFWLPHHCAALSRAFKADPACGIAFGHAAWLPCPARESDADDVEIAYQQALPRLLSENFVTQSCVAVRRQAALDAGGYREDLRYGEDYELWLRLARAGVVFAEVQAVTCHRTRHDAQVSERNVERMFESAWASREMTVRALAHHSPDLPVGYRDALFVAAETDLAVAWHSRRRSVLQGVLRAIAWVPGIEGRIEGWRARAGWQWPFWRTLSWIYDRLPSSLRDGVRATRPMVSGR